MSMTKRWAEAISVALGLQGAITLAVTKFANNLQKLVAADMVVLNPTESPIAIIRTPGDRSVGIQPHEVQVVGLLNLNDSDFREQLRNDLRELFVNVLDDRNVVVLFSDECGDCHQRMDRNEAGVLECRNPRCIRNIPGDDEI